jgi:hypothetical protein
MSDQLTVQLDPAVPFSPQRQHRQATAKRSTAREADPANWHPNWIAALGTHEHALYSGPVSAAPVA